MSAKSLVHAFKKYLFLKIAQHRTLETLLIGEFKYQFTYLNYVALLKYAH